MTEPIVGEIRLFACKHPPPGWLPCNGQVLDATEHAALFGVIGMLYGGDGRTTFLLPNLQGRVGVHVAPDIALGDRGGEETHDLVTAEMPNHTHLLSAHAQATSNTPVDNFWSAAPGGYSHGTGTPEATLAPHALAPMGDGEPHPNMQPYLSLSHCIAWRGTPPSADAPVDAGAMVGEVRMFAGNEPPRGWAPCDGQLLSIQDHTHLFLILGTTFGGDGQSCFALPDLRGRAPLHEGQGPGLTPHALGESGGDPRIMLTQSELPMHSHVARCGAASGQHAPEDGIWASTDNAENAYAPATDNTLMSPRSVEYVGGNAPHNNMQPYIGLSYIIALEGTLPQNPKSGLSAAPRAPDLTSSRF